MKIGLFFGSFNPIHTGHLIIANHLTNFYVDSVWFVVSPQNPFKESNNLLKAEHRLQLVQLAVKNNKLFEASSVEFNLPVPSYTINTLKHLSEKFAGHEFFLIMGSDNFLEVSSWKDSADIVKSYKLFVYERPGFFMDNDLAGVTIIREPLLNISATQIRKLIKENKSVQYLVPENVREVIEINGYFK